MLQPFLSVFTPTYNRAHTIDRVWESLKNQTYKNFEWVVIDDGSSDGIVKKIEAYKKADLFPILFHKFPKNRGKHNATNKGLEICNGEFFVVADSDDEFMHDALQFFVDGWNSIPVNERKNFSGIRACCEDQFGNRVSDILSVEPLDASMSEAFYKYKFRKESWSMVDTALHREHLFPPDHKGYYPEGIKWKAMSNIKKLRFFNKVIRRYFIEDDPNSLMRQKSSPYKKISRNIVGSYDVLTNDIKYFNYYPYYFFLNALLFSRYNLLNGSFLKAFKSLNLLSAQGIVTLTFPLGFLIYLKDKLSH